ncbi:F-box domain-containing protein [Mycena kentingensis (nom. inval.)]|nr:F-box domain-containing protein [Mycena kentingensis (nom. inval.)]
MLSQAALVALAALWLIKALVSRALAIRAAIRSLRAPYGAFHILNPFHTPAMLAGPWFPSAPQIGSWYSGFLPYAKLGTTCIGAVTRTGIAVHWFSDAKSIQFIASNPSIFQKDIAAYKPLNFYGENIVGTEGSDWRRHRRIAKPAFSEAGHALVWKETLRIANEWFADLDARFDLLVNTETDFAQTTLLIISSAGFGRRASWHDDGVPAPGHALGFRQAVFEAVRHLQTKVLTPGWLYALSERVYVPLVGRVVRDTQAAYDALRVHMLELVGLARAWVVDGKKIDSGAEAGLLRNLVEANMDVPEGGDLGQRALTEDELLSDMFTFLLAGHETTAHTLAFAAAYLALYPDIQRKIYEETVALWPDGVPNSASASSYQDLGRLPYTLAVFHETLRHFPAIVRLAKMVCADSVVPAYRFDSLLDATEIKIPLTAGGIVMLDIRALHYNPLHWGTDADEFKPERFIDTESYKWPREAFAAFSAGPRSCIGQRFAVTEGVGLLACLVRTYELAVPQRLRALSPSEQRKEMLAWRPGVTMSPSNAFVQLTKRK